MAQRSLRAKWLFIGDGSLLQNGMLRVDEDGRILEVGLDILADEIEEFEALCPGFVNTHCHLELSHLLEKVPMHQGLHAFIPSLQSQRDVPLEEIKAAINKWDSLMKKNGIMGVGDISNSNHTLETKKGSKIHYHTFIELFGLREYKAEEILQTGMELKALFQENSINTSLSPHSPYSVSEKLFHLIEENESKGPISIHNQESEGEILMFKEGSGPLKEMLLNFGNQEESLSFGSENSLLRSLKYINTRIPFQLVHNTFTDKEDIRSAEELHPHLYWCFCPSANWYIEKRLPNIPLFIEENVKCTLGTDSLASNHGLSILDEMKLIKQHYPQISTTLLLQWACKNGAEYLRFDELGTFEVGKVCGINELISIDEKGEIMKETKLRSIF